jgi:hypothetical protein
MPTINQAVRTHAIGALIWRCTRATQDQTHSTIANDSCAKMVLKPQKPQDSAEMPIMVMTWSTITVRIAVV